jgi:hypothetical protein
MQLRKTITDVGFMFVTLAAAIVAEGLVGDADDDEKNFYATLAYMANRLNTELIFYSNPVEFIRIADDPAPAVSMVSDIVRFGNQLMNPSERYVQGRRKGQYKIIKRVEKVFPFYRHYDRFMNMPETLTFFNYN